MSRLFSTTLLVCGLLGIDRADGDPTAVQFERDILPIFKTHCYSCHDAKKQTASYRLDIRSHAMKGGESEKVAIKPGDAKASELYLRITKKADDEERMPPKNAKGGPLSAKQIELVQKWIDGGAKWPDSLANEVVKKHWAFEPPVRPDVPKLAVHPIDAFVQDKLAAEGLTASKPADKITLIRRLTLDLIGLPPTVKEVDEFVVDQSPTAVNKVIDRLLASPHYGERWARLWLDAARYADSDGFEKDKPRFVWFYRDWVINSFNANMPYDRFLTEQLAGDLLPNATQNQKVATGFLRNSMINEEGGIDPEQFRMEAMFDRMDAIGKAMLGLTIQCAQCHTHKYDPITHQDYYRLFAFLNNSFEANLTVFTPEELQKRAKLLQEIQTIEDGLKERMPDWNDRFQKWIAAQPKQNWITVRPNVPDESTGGSRYDLQKDGSFIANGYAPTKHSVKLEWYTHLDRITGFQLELLNHADLPRNGPGRSIEGTAALTEFEVNVGPADKSKPTTKVKFVRAMANAEMPETPIKSIYHDKSNKKRVLGPIGFAIDGKDETAWGHDINPVQRNQPFSAIFVPEKPIEGFRGGTFLQIVLKQNHGGWNSDDNQNCNLGRFRVSVTGDDNPTLNLAKDATFSTWRTTVAEWKEANQQINDILRRFPEGTTQLIYTERTEPRSTMLLKRGDFLKPGELVSAGVPAVLNPLPENVPTNRIGFAKWLTARNAPTTARSFVNRVWQAYFGTGLVSTSEDLGTQCEPPSHPALLDWLAVEFVESGWDVKKLHRLVVTSRTYQQSSQVTAENLAKDPTNRWLARFPRVRVDAEIVRDIALTASGLLNAKVGGPSVYPPIPEFLMQPPASYGPKVWPESKGDDRYRRAMYTFRFRSVPHPALAAFDAPNGDFACVKRSRSNTPLQALAGLNEPLFLEAAKRLASKMVSATGDESTKISLGFRQCVSRFPSKDELAVLTELLMTERKRNSKEDTAWVAVARVLLNLDETVTRE